MNSKRASQIKNLGHAEEMTFNALFGDKGHREINHSGASNDNVITNPKYRTEISNHLGKFHDYTVSLKSGKTWQFHLGQIKELSDLKKIKIKKSSKGETKVIHSVSFPKQMIVLKTQDFWMKYLGKSCDLLCYNDKQKSYTFFSMKSVVQFLSERVNWVVLESGRLKGALEFNNRKYNILTFEYRSDKKQVVLGASGGHNGYKLFEVLRENLNSHEICFERSTTDLQFGQLKLLGKKRVNRKSKAQVGSVYFDDNFLYICIDDNAWKKIELKDL